MNRKRTCTSLVLALLIVITIPSLVATAQAPSAPVDPYIWEVLKTEEQAEVLVVLKEQADLEGARLLQTKAEKGWYVYQQLTATAARTQGPLRAYLDGAGVPYRAYWIQNMFKLQANASLVRGLAAHPDVGHIEYYYPVYHDVEPDIEPADPADAVEWNITRVGAPLAWARGYDGTGAVVGDLDSGVQWDHPALINQYREQIPGAPTRHDYNWFDGLGGSATPTDYDGHGTHTMGTIVGDDGGSNQIGMAPGARWIACAGIGSPYVGAFDCFQWFMAPTQLDGSSPRPDLAPDVINNSWSSAGTNYRDVIHTLYMAGIYYAKSAGNTGPSCGTVTNPGQWPEVTATAAFAQGDTIASFSSRGPVVVDRETVVKPDVAAPGVAVRSSYPTNNYTQLQGTSMACPHVTGAVALIISARPELAGQIDTIQHILKSSAEPVISAQCPPYIDHPNDVWGWGILDVNEAITEALGLGLGWLDGTVTAAATGDALEDARIDLAEDGTGWTLIPRYTDASGYYAFTALPTSTYHLTATHYGYLPGTATVTIPDGLTHTQDLALDTAPLWTMSGHLVEEGTLAPLGGQLTFEGTPIVATSDPATGFYSTTIAQGTFWTIISSPGHSTQVEQITIDDDLTRNFTMTAIYNYYLRPSTLPCDAPPYEWIDATDGTVHPLSDDSYFFLSLDGRDVSFYGNTYTSIYVGSNGIATFQLPANKWSGPIPDPATPNNGIYAFSTDMDPSVGQGDVYHKWVGNVLVLEWYQVEHFPSGSPETFEMLIDTDSDVVTVQYHTVSDPTDVTSGVENAAGDEATAYLGPLVDGLALTYYPAFSTPPAYQGLGTLEGTVMVSGTVEPIPGAVVTAVDGGTFSTTTDLSGTYSLELCADSYTLTAEAVGYLPAVGWAEIFSDTTTVQDFDLVESCEPVAGANFIWDPLAPLVEDIVTFTATVAAGTEPISYTWSFGDDGTGAGTVVTHSYAAAGDYTVVMTATNCAGQYTTSTSDVVTVWAPCEPVHDLDFGWTPLTPTAGVTVTFTAAASGTPPIAYAWDLGDGASAAGAVVAHVYTATGTYSVTVTATNCVGAGPAVKTYAVTVFAAPPQRWTIYLPLLLRGDAP